MALTCSLEATRKEREILRRACGGRAPVGGVVDGGVCRAVTERNNLCAVLRGGGGDDRGGDLWGLRSATAATGASYRLSRRSLRQRG